MAINDIIQNLSVIENRIATACSKSGRSRDEVRLLLATKTVSVERIKIALAAGQTLIGENKVQELKEKYDGLKDMPHENHFIGHLQSNKIKDILQYDVSCIQTLDSIDLAQKLHNRLAVSQQQIEVLVQVNTSTEKSKFGIAPTEAAKFCKALQQFHTLKIKGLMTIGLFSAETEKVRACFKILKNVQQQIAAACLENIEMKELSMGMSHDLETAIKEGATIVRIGTAVFGERIYPDSYYWNESNN